MDMHRSHDLRPWQRAVCAFVAAIFYLTLGTPYAVRAQEGGDDAVYVEAAPAADDSAAASRELTTAEELGNDDDSAPDAEQIIEEAGEVEAGEGGATEGEEDDATRPQEVQALPDGAAKSAVTPQAISLPKAEGSIEGMGESFTPNLSAGTGTFSVPIALPPGRAGVQPSLALSYGTSAGNGPLGVGWSMGAPFIARQTDRGLPRYVDQAAWHPEEDRFIYNGGQELVPIDSDEAAAIDGGTIPADLTGWQQYRARIEGAFMRFFRSPDSLRWVVQDKNGTRFEFGLLDPGDGPPEMVDASADSVVSEIPGGGGRIFSWNITRTSDAHGSTVYYRYEEDQGQRYLSDIHYVSPASCASANTDLALRTIEQRSCQQPLSDYGRRVRLVYEDRPDVFDNYTSTWRVRTALRLRRVEVTSYDSTAGQRTLVRRYHLRYDPLSFISMLDEVQVEGRPDDDNNPQQVFIGDRTVSEADLTDAVIGRLLPPMVFHYSQPEVVTTERIPGFGGLDGRVWASPSSPNVSVSEGRSDLFDVNSDGLPDLIVTDPARHRTDDDKPAVGVYYNGFSGEDAVPGEAGGFSAPIPMGMPDGESASLNLANLNVNPMDIDGDGRSDLLHMPRLRNYGYYTPTRDSDGPIAATSPAQQGWYWAKQPVVLPDGQLDPRVDFGRDSQSMQQVDVNNDHLVDVVRTTGTGMQTFLNLGWLPGGDGLFGSATYTEGGWELSTAPIESCLLHLGVPVDFADPEVRFADMNGDGIQDLVKIRRGRVAYWPGRGAGLFGEGDPTCGRNEGGGREVEMFDPPEELNPELDAVYFADINMDGVSDVVQVRFDEIDVWFNQAGHGFTDRVIIGDTPASPGFANRIRFTDLDGSGTSDIVYATADTWRYIDPMGGLRPRLLIGVENGLGGLTELEYGSSVQEYLRDLHDAESCADSSCERFTWSRVGDDCDGKLTAGCFHRSGGSPVVSTVVTAVNTSDQFSDVGTGEPDFANRIEYRYHDGYYEGIEQEFRGFGVADAVEVGDQGQPTSTTRTHLYQGRRPQRLASDRAADNPNEALKGQKYLSEVFDESGVYLSTRHDACTVRTMLHGLDGRRVSYVYVSQSDDFRYDVAAFASNPTVMELPAITREAVTSGLQGVMSQAPEDDTETTRMVVVRDRAAHLRSGVGDSARLGVDNVGNERLRIAYGRVEGEFGERPDEVIESHVLPALVSSEEWIWRATTTFTRGHDDLGQDLKRAEHTHSPIGEVVHSVREANLPTNAPTYEFGTRPDAHDQLLQVSALHDAWGNKTWNCIGADLSVSSPGECLRFVEIEYDSSHYQFAVAERIAARPDASANGFATLDTTAAWDEGFGALVGAVDPNGYETRVTYDGVGRLTSVSRPSVIGYSTAAGVVDCQGSEVPVTRIGYALADELGAPVNAVATTTEQDCRGIGMDTLETVEFVDGLGRVRATLLRAEDQPGISEPWQRSAFVRFGTRGKVYEAFQPDFVDGGGSGTDMAPEIALATPSSRTPSRFTFYDPFGREVAAIAEDGSATRTVHHALSADIWDAQDLDLGSPHYGTPTTERSDGHGRPIDQVLRNRPYSVGTVEHYRLWTDYRADGEIIAVTRAQTVLDRPKEQALIVVAGSVPSMTERLFLIDTAGRRVGIVDPDTDSRTAPASRASWRYLFNRAGDVTALRDPRGCGQDFYYDHAGRVVAEHYVGCGEAQQGLETAADTVPADAIGLDAGDGVGVPADVRHYFDAYPFWADDPSGSIRLSINAPSARAGVLGHATATMDRSHRAAMAYDRRGNVVWNSREFAVLPSESSIPSTTSLGAVVDDTEAGATVLYDATRAFPRSRGFDHAGRLRTTGLPGQGLSEVKEVIDYNSRGLPLETRVEGPGGGVPTLTMTSGITYTRDGLTQRLVHGEAGVESLQYYDQRRRPVRTLTTRAPGSFPGSAATQAERPLDAVSVVMDQTLVWDSANNLVELVDGRVPEEWPDGFRPTSYRVTHDSLYRVAGIEFDYTGDGGVRTVQDPFVDYRDELASVEAANPMRTRPAPLLPARPSERVASLTYAYDWLANMVEWSDDAYQFYERSLGAIYNGHDFAGEGGRPSALVVASDLESSPPTYPLGDRGGYLIVDYGEGGNVVAFTVRAQCADADFLGGQVCHAPATGDLASRRTVLQTNCVCASEQHYQYRWDELNRLSEARRYDRAGAGTWQLAARQRFRYDGSNQRMIKQTVGLGGAIAIDTERVTLYAYPDSWEWRGIVADEIAGANTPSADDEVHYTLAGGRLVWESTADVGSPSVLPEATIVLDDHINTTAAVVDVWGELTEYSSYYPTGARESYRSPDAADTGFYTGIGPEPDGFTGKEADEEIGLTYFGERYLIPRLARWATPDPLWIHAAEGGEVLNAYHYVSGNVLQARDPLGLDGQNGYTQEQWDAAREYGQALRGAVRSANEASVEDNYLQLAINNPEMKALEWIGWAKPVERDDGKYEYRLDQDAMLEVYRGMEDKNLQAWVGRWYKDSDIGYSVLDAVDAADKAALLAGIAGLGYKALRHGAREGAERMTVRVLASALLNTVKRWAGVLCSFPGETVVATASGSVPISEVSVGDWITVSGEGCESDSVDGWMRAVLRHVDPESGDITRVELLRPPAVVQETGLRVGALIEVELEEPRTTGLAEVVDLSLVRDSAESQPHGCPVTGIFSHTVEEPVVRIALEGEPDPIEVTTDHRFRSAGGEWLVAGDLDVGDEVETLGGVGHVVGVQIDVRREQVFNLEIAEAHTYFVHEAGVLVHNGCAKFSTYVLRNERNQIVYVGITKREPGKRMLEHLRSGKKFKSMQVLERGLTYRQARNFEGSALRHMKKQKLQNKRRKDGSFYHSYGSSPRGHRKLMSRKEVSDKVDNPMWEYTYE